MIARLRPLRPYLARYKKRFVLGFAALVMTQAIGALIPLVIMAGVDAISHHSGGSKLLVAATVLVGAALVKAVFQFWMRWILIGISRDVEYDLRNDLFRHLEQLSPAYYTSTRTGDLMSKLTNDLNAVRNLVGPGIMYSANTVVVGLATIGLMLGLDWRLTLIVIAPLPLGSIVVRVFGRKIYERFEKIQAMYSELTERVRENLAGVKIVRAFCQEEAEEAEFDRMNKEFVEKNQRLIWITSFLWPALALLFALAFMLLMLVGGRHVLAGRITLGAFAAFNVYLMYLIWPIIALGWVTNLVERGLASLGRLMGIFDARPDIDDRDVPEHPIEAIRGEIEFRNLSFSYPPAQSSEGKPILKNINLHIPAGKTVAIVGATGSGKSSLASLVPRLYDAPPGTLFVDGVPVREIPLRTLRSHIGFVPQETFLFSQTVAENIKFGATDATAVEVERAAEIAHILPDVREFPKGFETMVGERGPTLSGGQKQRAAIARAVLRDPRILILDDALSSVDTYTEEKILAQLAGVMAGRTTLLISHRISTIRNADEIVVLDGGTIAERGTHGELLSQGGLYADLYQRQLMEEELEKA